MGQFVPIAPANCCKMCLSETVRPIDECADLNMCSGHGMCVTGSCECSPGWGGADCGVQVGMVECFVTIPAELTDLPCSVQALSAPKTAIS